MLIEWEGHKRWMIATGVLAGGAIAGQAWLNGRLPGGWTGGTVAGMWYGVAGSLLMIYAGLLAAHRKVPKFWWLVGTRRAFLKGHIWLGLLSGVVILCHSGYRWGGPLELVLWIVFLLVLGSGIFGLFLQQLLPRLITTRVICEVPYEQIPHVCQGLQAKADKLVGEISGNTTDTMGMETRGDVVSAAALETFYTSQVRPFLAPEYPRSSPLASALVAKEEFERITSLPGLTSRHKMLKQLQDLCDERRLLAVQDRIHHWLHAWLLIHVPLSIALLVLGVAHVGMSLYY